MGTVFLYESEELVILKSIILFEYEMGGSSLSIKR